MNVIGCNFCDQVFDSGRSCCKKLEKSFELFDIFLRVFDNIEWNEIRSRVCEFWWMYALAKFAMERNNR